MISKEVIFVVLCLPYFSFCISSENPKDSTVSLSLSHDTERSNENDVSCDHNCLNSSFTQYYLPRCPNLQQIYLVNHLPNGNGNRNSGITRNVTSIDNLEDCVAFCCDVVNCNFAIMRNSCQLFFCTEGVKVCMPKLVTTSQSQPNKLVLVRPPLSNFRPNSTCETGILHQCHEFEECFPNPTNEKSRNGYCGCVNGFIYSTDWKCVEIQSEEELEILQNKTTIPTLVSPSPTPVTVKNLEVSVVSKNVTLPEDSVDLYAYAVPQSTKYTYEWKLMSHPSGDDTGVQASETGTTHLHLSRLIEGVYVFQVIVKGENITGKTEVSVHVFPAKRKNQNPVAIIKPSSQTIQLPTTSAILDGSSSSDDGPISELKYNWELKSGPIQYDFAASNKLTTSPTLQILSLIPGNYTFKLTVEDKDHGVNFTTANLTVLKMIDYPPQANPGPDAVIFLPQNSVTLNGSLSSDDRGIVQWEWKTTGDVKKAVDMQNSHTPYLKVSGLEEGIYQFELTVTDEAGQVSKPSVVHLFVKPAGNNSPKADAGEQQTVTLPQSWTLLDASGSKSDSKIVGWKWSQLRGPINATLQKNTEAIVNATGLIAKGEYLFQIEIETESKLMANSTVKVVVVQRPNEPPKAVAFDVTVTLPVSLVQLDGSSSKFVKEWLWQRQPNSLAAGVILDNSHKTSHLKLTGLIPGKYTFKLIVKNEEGMSDEVISNIFVNEDPIKKSLIQIVLGVKMTQFMESEREKFLQKMSLLVHNTSLVFHHLTSQLGSEFATIFIYGRDTDNNETVNPLLLSSQLREKLRLTGLLDFPVEYLDSLLCLNPCSGHGVCHDFSSGRECVCDAFWVENYLKRHFGSGERNCDWSKIYVGLIVCILLIMKFSLIWSLVYLFRRYSRRRAGKLDSGLLNGSLRNGSKRHHNNGSNTSSHKNKQYSLLDDDDELEMEIRADEPESDDSDSEESLIFERGKDTSSKSVSASLLKNPIIPIPCTSNGLPRNGILKKPRAGIKA